jgi:hypothetical protein
MARVPVDPDVIVFVVLALLAVVVAIAVLAGCAVAQDHGPTLAPLGTAASVPTAGSSTAIVADRRRAHGVLDGEVFAQLSVGQAGADLLDFGCGERRPRPGASFGVPVSGVVGLGAEPQVIEQEARRVVTAVQDTKPLGDRPIDLLPHPAVDADGRARWTLAVVPHRAAGDLPVALAVPIPLPFPARCQ